jgi:hypothetical protein
LNNYPRPKNTKNQIKRIEEEEEEEESDYIARVPLWSRILRVCVCLSTLAISAERECRQLLLFGGRPPSFVDSTGMEEEEEEEERIVCWPTLFLVVTKFFFFFFFFFGSL